MLMKTGGRFPNSLRERQLVLFHRLVDRELYIVTAGEAVSQTAAHARKQIGCAAHVATGTARIAKTHTMNSV
jgi:hypothetical protein